MSSERIQVARLRLGRERWAVALAASLAAGMVLYVGLRGLGAAWWLGAAIAAGLGVVGCRSLARRLPSDLDGLARTKRAWCIAWLVVAILALVQTARMSAFMIDPATQQAQSLFPSDSWYIGHSCLTAYAEAARLATEGAPNIYVGELYLDRKIDGFNVDAYHYPPSFLLLPLALRAIAGSVYTNERMCWFAISALALLLALGAAAAALDPPSRRRAIAAAPAIWISVPVQLGFQMSNVQLLVIAITGLAWVAFRRWRPLGAALLALAAVAKIFPGVLVLDLLLRRRWRDAATTAGFGLAFCGASYAIVGAAPFRAFFRFELPHLSTGEAFARPFLRAFAVGQNMSPFGIALKLEKLGVPGATLAAGRVLGTIFGLALIALAVWASRRTADRPPTRENATNEIAVWLALLSLGTLASPFAPANYVLASLVWLVAIDRNDFSPAFAAIVGLATSAPFLLPREGNFLLRSLAFLPAQIFAVGVPAYVLWRAGRRRERSNEIVLASEAQPRRERVQTG